MLRRAAHAVVPRLLERGVRVYEYEDAIMHAKSAVFDGELGVIGTSNLDRQSFEHSYEVNLILKGHAVTDWLDARFDKDRGGSRGLDLEGLAARDLWDRLLDRLAALLLHVV